MTMNVDPVVYRAAVESMPGLADYVAVLLYLSPNYGRCRTRLAIAAYRKGIIAGLAGGEPVTPYKPEYSYPNFMKGENYPGFAWKLGVDDASRIRRILTEPEKAATIYPSLLQSEYKALPENVRAIIDASDARDVGIYHTANGLKV